MPYKSQAQAGYFHTHKAELEKQGVDVGEWDRATKGKSLPKRVGYSQGGLVVADGHNNAEYAKGGAARDGDTRWAKKEPQGRGRLGQFLGTKDRFTDGEQQRQGDTPQNRTDENWEKPAGVGRTDADDCGDTKSLKAVKPRS